jgi:hypothetical protein
MHLPNLTKWRWNLRTRIDCCVGRLYIQHDLQSTRVRICNVCERRRNTNEMLDLRFSGRQLWAVLYSGIWHRLVSQNINVSYKRTASIIRDEEWHSACCHCSVSWTRRIQSTPSSTFWGQFYFPIYIVGVYMKKFLRWTTKSSADFMIYTFLTYLNTIECF